MSKRNHRTAQMVLAALVLFAGINGSAQAAEDGQNLPGDSTSSTRSRCAQTHGCVDDVLLASRCLCP